MDSRSSFLPRISVTRPVTVTMTLVALLVVGLVSYTRLQSQAFPSGWENRWLWVGVDFSGLAPQEIDRQIRRPIEEHIRTVKGVRGFESFASSQWGLWMGVWLREDANMQLAYNQLMDIAWIGPSSTCPRRFEITPLCGSGIQTPTWRSCGRG